MTKKNTASPWWADAVIYQVYPRSFADSNGDGIGDLPGVTSRLEYLKDLGVDAIWLSPFYPSPQVDCGYDVADYRAIAPEYGTMSDFEKMVHTAHELGLRVIIDVVPNHSSSQHQWFQEALAAGPNSPERDRYIFRFSDTGTPNNWGSIFGGSAWSQVDSLTGSSADKDWWYLHLFDSSQPDFNWNHPDVRSMFEDYFQFWMDKGVDGFRVDVAHALVKEDGLPDDQVGPDRFAYSPPEAQGEIIPAPEAGPFFDQDGVHEVYRSWRRILDEYSGDRMLVAEAWVEDPARLALYVRPDEMQQAFNFQVMQSHWDARELRKNITTTYEANSAVGAVTTWVMSNHDRPRHATRYGYPTGAKISQGIGLHDPLPDSDLGLVRALAMTSFLLGLPGSMYLYNGEELGLPEVLDLPDDARTDPTWFRTGGQTVGRDGCRVPLPWTTDPKGFGFSSNPNTWLPQPSWWGKYAVQIQRTNEASVLNFYKRALQLRKQLKLGYGTLLWEESAPDTLTYRNGNILVAMNLGRVVRKLDYAGEVLLCSPTSPRSPHSPDDTKKIRLAHNSTIWIDTSQTQ